MCTVPENAGTSDSGDTWYIRQSLPYTFAVVLGTNVALPCFLQCWYVQPTTVSKAHDYSYSCFILPHLLSMWSYYIVFLVIFLSFGYMEQKLIED